MLSELFTVRSGLTRVGCQDSGRSAGQVDAQLFLCNPLTDWRSMKQGKAFLDCLTASQAGQAAGSADTRAPKMRECFVSKTAANSGFILCLIVQV